MRENTQDYIKAKVQIESKKVNTPSHSLFVTVRNCFCFILITWMQRVVSVWMYKRQRFFFVSLQTLRQLSVAHIAFWINKYSTKVNKVFFLFYVCVEFPVLLGDVFNYISYTTLSMATGSLEISELIDKLHTSQTQTRDFKL